MKKWLQTMALAIGSALLVACGGGADEPAKVAESFFQEMFSGDAGKAIELVYLPPEAMQAGMNEEQVKGKLTLMFSAMQEEIKKQGGVDSVKAGEVTYTNSDKTAATVKVTIKPKNGEASTEEIPLIKTDKGWKINMQ